MLGFSAEVETCSVLRLLDVMKEKCDYLEMFQGNYTIALPATAVSILVVFCKCLKGFLALKENLDRMCTLVYVHLLGYRRYAE